MKTTAALVLLMGLLFLSGCTSFEDWRRNEITSQAPYASSQGPSHMQSTEGRYDFADGRILEDHGYYYLAPTRMGIRFDLDRQDYVKKFVNLPVEVDGYFDYDRDKIIVTRIKPIEVPMAQR